jgi:hypothetical protein
VNVDQLTLQEYIRTQIGRQPKHFRQMEDDLNFLGKFENYLNLFKQMEDHLNFLSK